MVLPSADSPLIEDGPPVEAAAGPLPRPRRPLPALVISLMTGMTMGVMWPVGNPWPAFAAAGVLLLWASLSNSRPWTSSFVLHLALIAVGAAWMIVHVHVPPAHDLRRFLTSPRQYVELAGNIVSHPQVEGADPAVWRFEFAADSWISGGGVGPVVARLRVRFSPSGSNQPPAVAYGDRWQLRGVFTMDDRPLVKAQGITGSLSVQAERCRRLEGNRGNPLVAHCYRFREAAANRLGWGMPEGDETTALTRALLLGYRQDVPAAVHDAFARTGTLHLLALSGLHVGILVLILVIALKAVGVHRPYWICFFLPFLMSYAIATGAAASTLRAAIMAMVFYAAYFFRRRPDGPTSLAVAALVILLWDPLQLFNLGFILSFVVVSGLILLPDSLTPLAASRQHERDGSDPENSWWPGFGRGARLIGNLFVVSLAAWLASVPLIASAFHVISPIALVVNLALVPLAFVILLTTCLALAGGMISVGLAALFNHANSLFGHVLLWTVDITSQLPWSHQYVAAWPWYLVAGWYGCLIAWVAGRRAVRLLAGLSLMLLLAWSLGQRAWSDRVKVVVIPSAESLVMLVDGPGTQARLFDTGSAFRNRALIEHLRSRGINILDQVWITRANTDAYGGLSGLLDALVVRQVFVPPAPAGQRVFHEQRAGWTSHDSGVRVEVWPMHRHVEADGGLVMRVLHPPLLTEYRNARQSALMVHVSRGHDAVLFTGAAHARLEQLALAGPADFDARTLVAGSCQAVDALSEHWLNRVGAREVILSAQGFDRLPQGAGPLLDRLRANGARTIIVVEDEPVEWVLNKL